MKLTQSLLTLPVFYAAMATQADSDIKVRNYSYAPVQVIWQAGGCLKVTEDWEGDNQYTVCREMTLSPNAIHTFTFGSMQFDRSVKVFSHKQGEIGHCNSMDDEVVDVQGTDDGDLHTVTTCDS